MRFGTYYFLQAPPERAHPEVVQREIEQMAWTEELGFDSIWLTEHHFIEYGLSVSPAVLAARGRHADAPGAHRPGRRDPALPRSRSASPRSWRWWTS